MSYVVDPAHVSTTGLESSPVAGALAGERDLVIASRPLEVSDVVVEGTRMACVSYESELADRSWSARQRSTLAGTVRGSFFVIKGEH